MSLLLKLFTSKIDKIFTEGEGDIKSRRPFKIFSTLSFTATDKIKSFAVGQEGSPDILAARVVAAQLGTEHIEMFPNNK